MFKDAEGWWVRQGEIIRGPFKSEKEAHEAMVNVTGPWKWAA